MKKIKWLLSAMILVGFLFACNNTTNKGNDKNIKSDSTLTNTDEIVAIDFDKLNDNDAFDLNNKIVKISGLVDHICIHGGKRLMLVGTNPGESIEVLAGSHPPFTQDIVGTNIEVTGKFIANKIDSVYLANWEEEVKQKSIEGKKTVEAKHIEGSGEHKKGEGEGQKDITQILERIQQLREEIKANGKGYIPDFNIEFESMKQIK